MSELQTIEKKIGIWLDTKHLVLVGLLIVALLGAVYLFESKRADIAEAKADLASQAATLLTKAAANSALQNAAIQQANKEQQAALESANAQLIQANKQLQASNAQLTAKLINQQHQDAQLPPTGQASRWEALVPQATVTVTSAGFSVDPNGGLATLQDLEELTTDRTKIENLESESNISETLLQNEEKALQLEQAAHVSDLTNDAAQLKAANDKMAAVQAQFNAYKKKSHKNILKTLAIGVGIGIGIGIHF